MRVPKRRREGKLRSRKEGGYFEACVSLDSGVAIGFVLFVSRQS